MLSNRKAFNSMQFVDRYERRFKDSLGDAEFMSILFEETGDTDVYDDDICNSLTCVFEKHWFSRAWTFKETTYSIDATVLCESPYMKFHYLSQLLSKEAYSSYWDMLGSSLRCTFEAERWEASSRTPVGNRRDNNMQAETYLGRIHSRGLKEL